MIVPMMVYIYGTMVLQEKMHLNANPDQWPYEALVLIGFLILFRFLVRSPVQQSEAPGSAHEASLCPPCDYGWVFGWPSAGAWGGGSRVEWS